VSAALAELPPSQRRALVLHYFDDNSYDQIAAAMGVPLNTVKSHILRGKERMARLLSRPLRSEPVRLRPRPHRRPGLTLDLGSKTMELHE
jgi:DNA-directed RNA polymerase specialized sigma24 family protein